MQAVKGAVDFLCERPMRREADDTASENVLITGFLQNGEVFLCELTADEERRGLPGFDPGAIGAGDLIGGVLVARCISGQFLGEQA